MSADIAFINANIRTMNLRKPFAQAVAVKKNKIIRVASTQEIRKLIVDCTKVIDLHGKTMVPGLIDTHIHVADFGRCLMWLDLSCAKSIKEVQNLLEEKVKQTSAGKWIIGRGWDEKQLKEKRFLTLEDLDEAAPDNPVILYHGAAYICSANSKALTIARVSNQTIPPSGGSMDKTETGELTGIFRGSATNLIWEAVAQPTIEELTEAAALACQQIVQAGITSIDWIILSENEFPLIQVLYTLGKLSIRVNVIVPFELLKYANFFSSTDSSKLRLGGVIIFVDGYLDSKTAALQEPYTDDLNNSGKLLLTQNELTEKVEQVLALGLQPVIHAMGDKAIDAALTVIEKSEKKVRYRIEQAAILNEELVKRLQSQDVVVSVQPAMFPTEFTVWLATKHLGVKRAQWLHPLKTLLRKDIKVASGSDCPMEPLNPFLGMQEAVQRENFPEQNLIFEEALRMYTIDAAYCSSEENFKGSIEAGKLADLTVLSDDPFVIDSNRIKDITVQMTIMNGKVVFSNY